MKRQVVAGLAVAGALTLWAGASAFANQDPGDQGEALLQQAQTAASIASDQVSTCAETQIASFESATPPAGVSSDAAEEAVETAAEKVEKRADQALSDINTALENFAEQFEQAEEDGTALPAVQKVPDFAMIASAACTDITNIHVVWPAPSLTRTENEQETDRDSGKETERESSGPSTARD